MSLLSVYVPICMIMPGEVCLWLLQSHSELLRVRKNSCMGLLWSNYIAVGCVHLSFFAPGSWIVLCQGDLFCALCCVVHHCYLQDPSSRVFSQAVTDKNVSRCQMTRAKSTPSENFWLKVRRAPAFLLICVFIENVKYLEVIRQCCVLRIIVIFSIHVFLTIL